MDILTRTKELAALVKKVGDIELYEKIVSLQSDIVDLSGERFKLLEKCKVLEEQLAFRTRLTYKHPYYIADGTDRGPFCAVCWDVSKLAVHLLGPEPQLRTMFCPNCKNRFA